MSTFWEPFMVNKLIGKQSKNKNKQTNKKSNTVQYPAGLQVNNQQVSKYYAKISTCLEKESGILKFVTIFPILLTAAINWLIQSYEQNIRRTPPFIKLPTRSECETFWRRNYAIWASTFTNYTLDLNVKHSEVGIM